MVLRYSSGLWRSAEDESKTLFSAASLSAFNLKGYTVTSVLGLPFLFGCGIIEIHYYVHLKISLIPYKAIKRKPYQGNLICLKYLKIVLQIKKNYIK